MGRSPCCDKMGLKKGPWTPEEDKKLLAYIEEHGHGNWRALPTKAGLQRCGKSCRLRWTNYLRPDIKRGKFSLQEEQTIIQLHALLGNRWSAIATHLPKRTDNEIKNYWNTHLKKRLTKMGIDPVTHKPKNEAFISPGDGGGPQSKNAANLSHMAQWESARLEAEARLVRQSKLRLSNNNNDDNNQTSFGSPTQDLHIHDHNQIVPSLSPTHHPHHYVSMTTAAATATATPRCLDVLKAWHGEWPSTSTSANNNSNNEGILGIGMGLTGVSSGGGGGSVGVGIESPTSTLSFSENAPPVVPTMGTGGVIEFLGHNGGHDHQDMVKEEGDQHNQLQDDEWKRGFDHHNGIEINNSLSFGTSAAGFHGLNGLSIDRTTRTRVVDGKEEEEDEDDDERDDQDHGFMEGFTELLLSTKTTISEKKTLLIGEEGDHNNNHNNDDSSGRGGTSSSGGSDYYEDNKTYWNSILNLVNSSPSHSPMF